MKKKRPVSERANITMRPQYYTKADEISSVTGENFSELLRRLINQEHDRKFGGQSTLKKPVAAPSRALPHEARPKLRASSKRIRPSDKLSDPSLKNSHENPSS